VPACELANLERCNEKIVPNPKPIVARDVACQQRFICGNQLEATIFSHDGKDFVRTETTLMTAHVESHLVGFQKAALSAAQ
jgi:hypothetical protein